MSDTQLQPRTTPTATLVSVDGKPYALECVTLEARAEGGFATTRLLQRYANPYDEPLEVRYTLPLPVDGAVLGYTVTIGERVIRAEIEPRKKAEKKYREALLQGRTAGLLEQERPDTFTQHLGNVPPRTVVEIAIDVLHPVAFVTAQPGGTPGWLQDDLFTDPAVRPPVPSRWRYRFPTVVGMRYPGAPGRVDDAGALSPDRDDEGGIPVRATLELVIADVRPDGEHQSVESPSHALSVVPDGGLVRVGFAADERLDRDIVIEWLAGAPELGVRVAEGRGLEGDDGRYALVTIVPPATKVPKYGRDLTVLLDASGSMTGEPLDLAKQAISALLQTLTPDDRFELIMFADRPRRLMSGWQDGDARSVRGAIQKLRAVEASGGTEMLEGLREAMKSTRKDTQHQVVLVTDGQIAFESEVVREVAAKADVRLHALGVGAAPNRSLTQQAALAGRGTEAIVATPGQLADAVRELLAGTVQPVLTGVRVSGSALRGRQCTQLRDVFAGLPLRFTVEVTPVGGTLELHGSLAGAAWSQLIAVPPSAAATDVLPTTPLPLGAVHGRALVAECECLGVRDEAAGFAERLVERFRGTTRVLAEPDSVRRRIQTLGMRHRIVTRETSLVAIAEWVGVDPKQPVRRERLAVEVPAGVSAIGSGAVYGGPPPGALCMPDDTVFQCHQSFRPAGSDTLSRQLERARRALRDIPANLSADAAGIQQSASPDPRALVPVSVHWRRPNELVVEFECPIEGFLIADPTMEGTVFTGGDPHRMVLHLDEAHSTLQTPGRKGTIFRLVFVFPLDPGRLDRPGLELTLRVRTEHIAELRAQLLVIPLPPMEGI